MIPAELYMYGENKIISSQFSKTTRRNINIFPERERTKGNIVIHHDDVA
jgi:hypothetical protein